jgi:hypothetical protein
MLNNIGLPGLLLIILLCVFLWFSISQTNKGKLNFKNLHNGKLREAPIGFSWTTFFFGPFPALFRGHYLGAFIIFLILAVTFGLAGFVFPFIYNKWYVSDLIKDGYKVLGADGDIDVISKYLSRELPLIEATTVV